MVSSIDAVQLALEKQHYICDRSLATVLFLALKLERPILLEGEAGVGKTEVAKVMTAALGERLIRRPLIEAIQQGETNEGQTILLIDEIDRADEEFEAFFSKSSPTFRSRSPR